MGKKIQVAYEEEHTCKEGCGCLKPGARVQIEPPGSVSPEYASDSGYVEQVQLALADLGSDDPAGDIARNAKYVRGAQRAKLEPKQAAAMILAMSQRDPADYQPRYRYEDVAETAKEYIAVDHRGKKVFGPTDNYGEASLHARRAGGVVQFRMDAKEGAPPAAKDCVGVHTHGEPALEPYTKKVRFHRGSREGTYQADMGHLGRATCAQRSPDRRNGRLPWYVVVKKVEIAQAATKTEVYALAEEWARAPKTKAEEPPAAAECTPVIRNGRVERQPDCKSTGVELASAKDVWLITKDQYARQGHETFEVLGANLNSEMVDGPVTVAVGQTSGVRVEPEAVIIAALGLKNGGATQIWCSHPHPGGSPNPSPSDRNLDKAIREAFETLKSLEYKGQVVCTRTTFKRV